MKKSFEKVETRIKVLGMEKHDLVNFYNKLVIERSKDDFDKILWLRGLKQTEVDYENI